MKKALLGLAGIAVLLSTCAIAQPAPPPGGRTRAPEMGAPPPPPAVRDREGEADAPPPPRGARREGSPPMRGAHFRVEQGESAVDVKCADDEPMRACADITMQLLDRAMSSKPSVSPAPTPAAPR